MLQPHPACVGALTRSRTKSITLIRLPSQMHGAGEGLNLLAFPLLLDTLCYTLDGASPQFLIPIESH